jgi:ABC-type transport system substrate-binding protein
LTSKRLALIPNLRKSKLSDQAFRDKLFKGQKFDSKVNLTLTTLDADVQREKAESLKKEMVAQNVNLSIHYESPIELAASLQNKDFELLLYGFDFGYDRDLYAFWHSTLIGTTNYAGYSDKNTDILLEDARMMLDRTGRNAKYDQFFTILSNNSLAIFYDPLKYNFYISNQIRGVDEKDFGVNAASRFSNIEKWFLREDRTKK